MAFSARNGSCLWGTQLRQAPRPLCPLGQSRLVVQASQELEGTVVSTKMQKTIVVSVIRQALFKGDGQGIDDLFRLVKHPKYHKRVRKTKKHYAHDEEELCNEGDYVRIIPTRPLSKTKRFALAEVIRQAK